VVAARDKGALAAALRNEQNTLMDVEPILGGAAVALMVIVQLWISRSVPRHFDPAHDPIQLDLRPDRVECYVPYRDLPFPLDELVGLDLALIAALWYADELRPSELIELSGELLGAGVDSPWLRRLAGETATTRRDLDSTAEHTFKELQVAAPIRRTQARTSISRELARRVAKGKLAPHRAALSISRLHDWAIEGPQKPLVLANLAYEIAIADDPIADLRQIDQQSREACAAYLSATSNQPDHMPFPDHFEQDADPNQV
jgi:hypothetical protein